MASTFIKFGDSGAPAGVATTAGTLTTVLDYCLQAAGWTIAYSDTNKRAYRQGGGSQRYVWVDDSATASQARFRVFDTMSDVDTGTVPTPSDAQISGGLYVYKSSNTSARPWMFLGSKTDFYLYVGHLDTALSDSPDVMKQMVGVFDLDPDNLGATGIIGGVGVGASAVSFGQLSGLSLTTPHAGNYAIIDGASVQIGKMSDARAGNGMGVQGYSFPTADGLMLSPCYIVNPNDSRTIGDMPGIWIPLHNMPGSNLDTFDGVGALAGRSFMLANTPQSSSARRCVWEISSTWGPA